MILPPPRLEDLPAGHKLVAGMGYSTVIADFDFETYSAAGYLWDEQTQKFHPPLNAKVKGLPTIGAAAYAEHPSTEVLSMAYDLKDGKGPRLWVPGDNPPSALFEHLARGELLEAWNVGFERWIWTKVCVSKYGWPPLPFNQLRCAAAKSRSFALPGSLDPAGIVLDVKNKKNRDGKRLIDKFSMPRNPTKHDKRIRITPQEDRKDADNLYSYNLQDIAAEAEISSLIPDLSPSELEFWLCDQAINFRGVQLDQPVISNCISIIEQAYTKYDREVKILTNGKVNAVSEIAKLRDWMMGRCVSAPTLDAEVVSELLTIESLDPDVRRVLEIREMLGSSSVKKVYSMANQSTSRGRVHDLFIYHQARTGRAAGSGPQPQNLPNSGPMVSLCHCGRHNPSGANSCLWCGSVNLVNNVEWSPGAVSDALETMATGNLELMEYHWGNAIEIISACLRGMFIPAPGHDLICSDYSAIEAVVLAELAGESWRQEVFRTHGKIYEMSASKITGISFEDLIKHKKDTGNHHPMRKKVGKVAELASGYQGWIGAWKQFGADEFFNDEQIKQAILAWRKASPAIVEFWGGQKKNWQPHFYGLEGAAVQAVLYPGQTFEHRGITYVVKQNILYCKLLSGRYLTYHRPEVTPNTMPGREGTLSLSFEGWNTNPKYGYMGWGRMNTYGGKLTENVVQATSRDILAHAIVNLEKARYPVVLHVHDEIVAEIPEGYGSVEEFERIMSSLPQWAAGWPVKANGGWRGKRYAK